MLKYVAIGVVAFVGITGSIAALAWWRIADKWEAEENKRFKTKERPKPTEVTITDGGDTPADR